MFKTRLMIAFVLVLLVVAFTIPVASAASIDMFNPNTCPTGMEWAGSICGDGLPTWSG